MERNQLLYVITVAKHQNITNAAKELYITQPSLSNQIIKLEDELNIKLFERKNHRMYLTDAGEAFIKFAEIIINNFETLEQLMKEYSMINKYNIKIGILPIFSYLELPEQLLEFKEKFKNIDIKIKEAGSSALIKDILKKDLDVAFVILPENNLKNLSSELNITKLRKDKIMVILPFNHRLAKEKILKLENLVTDTFILSNTNYQFQNIILNYLNSNNIKYEVSCNCNQIDTMLTLVSKKFGITFCSESTAKYKLSKRKELNIVSIPLDIHFERTIYMVSLRSIENWPALKEFTNFIKIKYK